MPVSLSIDGSPMAIESRSSGIEFFAARKSVVALRVDGELRDLATDLAPPERLALLDDALHALFE
ncbi:MAG: hypothetical protein ACFN4T_05810, partial [Peptidiphaga sp.]